MSLGIFNKLPGGRALLWRMAKGRADDTVGHLQPHLKPGERLLDIGSGIGDITLRLRQAGYEITPLDVQNISCTPLITPTLYNGRHMPFKDKSFDTALLLTVLHHIPADSQLGVLEEASRVAKRLIIIEDVYSGNLHKFATQCFDSLMNLEFFGHPHSNRTDAEWRALFKRFGFRLQHVKPVRSFGFMRHRVYVLEAAS
jgi:ubiquinone/menaquinone biosynthesis C-methylase UbiE